MIVRFARRKDENQSPIVGALRQIGVYVHDASASGGGLTDLICVYRGRVVLIEIKDGSKPPSRRKLTPAQVDFHEGCRTHGYVIPIVETVDQALALFGAKPV